MQVGGAVPQLSGRDTDANGGIPLKKIGGSALPTALGTLLLDGAASVSCGGFCATGGGAGAGAASRSICTFIYLLHPVEKG